MLKLEHSCYGQLSILLLLGTWGTYFDEVVLFMLDERIQVWV